MKFTRITNVEDQRREEKTPEKDITGVTSRLAAARQEDPSLTVEDLGTKLPLRESDNLNAMVAGVQAECAKMAFPVTQRPDEVIAEPVAPANNESINERLMPLVVDPINALPEAQRTVKGVVRSGEEIAKAIPDVAAFLDAVSLRKDGKFFELNEAGQLVIEDGCPEAYGLGEDFPTAKMRQACVWYIDEQGVTQSLQGEELYTVKKAGVLELTEAAKKVVPTMVSGLPTLKWDGEKHTGEYARMNTGQLERSKATWTDDNSLDDSRARLAYWNDNSERVVSFLDDSGFQDNYRGSRGVLRVNLNLET